MKKYHAGGAIILLSVAAYIFWPAHRSSPNIPKNTEASLQTPDHTPFPNSQAVSQVRSTLPNGPLHEFLQLDDYAAYIHKTIAKPEPIKTLYAHELTTRCWGATMGREIPTDPMPEAVAKDSRRIHAYMRIEKLCGAGIEWSKLRKTLSTLDHADPLMRIVNDFEKLRRKPQENPEHRQKLKGAIQSMLASNDAVFLSRVDGLPIRRNIIRGEYSTYKTSFNGQWLNQQDAEAIEAAKFLLRCDLGLPCEQDKDILLLGKCSILGDCYANREEYVRDKFYADSPSMKSRVTEFRTALLQAIKSGNAEAFMPPPSK